MHPPTHDGAAEPQAAKEAPGAEGLDGIDAARLLPSLTATSSVGMAILRTDGRFERVNPALCSMLACSAEEVVGRHWTQFTHPDHIEAEQDLYAEMLAGRLPSFRRRKRYVGTDGRAVWGDLHATYVADDDQSPSCIVWQVVDISKEVALQGLLTQRHRVAEHRYERLFEESPVGIFTADATGVYTDVNEAGCEMLQRSRDEILGRSIADLVSPQDMLRLEASFERMNTEGRDHGDWEFPLPNGATFTGLVFSHKLTDGSIQAVVIDVGEKRRQDEALRESNERLSRMLIGITTTLGKIVETRDPYTQGHEEGVARLSSRIAREMGLLESEIEGIELAALLHDIGKMAVPAEILTKPGRLTEIEHRLIRVHSQAGHDILRNIEFDWPIAEIVLQHHERMDGSGYPRGLSGDDILPASRIIMAADVLEAMGAHRPYRPALGVSAAMEVITGNAHQFDPDVVTACVSLHESGALAELLDN